MAHKTESPTGRRIIAEKEKGGKITTAGRLSLPRAKFALPPRPEERRRGIKGRFPIDTEARARNALSRAAQTLSPADEARVRRAIAREFPGIEQNRGRKK